MKRASKNSEQVKIMQKAGVSDNVIGDEDMFS